MRQKHPLLLGMLIGTVTTLGAVGGLILVLLANSQRRDTPYIPLYPNGHEVIRYVWRETDPNIFGQEGILLDHTTTFQTTDSPATILTFYREYMHKFRCETSSKAQSTAKLEFRCELPTRDDLQHYYSFEITLTPGIAAQSVAVRQTNSAVRGFNP